MLLSGLYLCAGQILMTIEIMCLLMQAYSAIIHSSIAFYSTSPKGKVTPDLAYYIRYKHMTKKAFFFKFDRKELCY